MHSSSTDPSSDLRKRFLTRAGLSDQPSLWELVEAVREIPYGRPASRTPEGVVEEWKGTCSTKHELLAELLSDRPEFSLGFVHRVYRVSVEEARARFGDAAAATVPEEGLVDVHSYVTALIGDQRVRLDVTFPGKLWDGHTDMELACGDGTDYPVGEADTSELKERLVAEFCDPAVREPFIAALSI